MRDARTHTVIALACAATLLPLAACGDSEGSDTTSTSSSATYDDDHAMDAVREIDKKFRAHDPSTPIGEDEDWATDKFRTRFNDELAALDEEGVVRKGSATTESLHLKTSDPDAPGGWDLTVYMCSLNTTRLLIDGEDVTADPANPGQLLPDKPRHDAFLNTYTTPDSGKTWQLDIARYLDEDDKKESPCAA